MQITHELHNIQIHIRFSPTKKREYEYEYEYESEYFTVSQDDDGRWDFNE